MIALRTTLTLDDALLLRELDEVGSSWEHAGRINSDALTELERKRNANGRT